MSLLLRNPHSVLAVLQKRPEDLVQLRIPRGGAERSKLGDTWAEVERLAREHDRPIFDLAKGGGGKAGDGRHSSAEAQVKEAEGVSAEELFADANERSGGRGIWLALDSLQDPQNVGAIFRTAAFFGIDGILLTQERSAPLTAVVYDVASGGVDHVPFCLQINLQRAFEIAKEAGLWILGTSEHAKTELAEIKRDRPWLIVLGNEEKGIRRLTEESCDMMCSIAPAGDGVTSLNVSVAAGVLVSQLARAERE